MCIFSFLKLLSPKRTVQKPIQLQKKNTPSKLFPLWDECIICPYDITRLAWVFSGKCADTYNGDFYIMPSAYFNTLGDIMDNINNLLKEAFNKNKRIIPLFNYDKRELCFIPSTESVFDCCMFFYHPIGYKGKESKEPYSVSLRFGRKLNDYFKVFYNKKAEIVRIDCFCYSKDVYRICFTKQKGVLDLYCIYKTTNSATSLLYGVWQNKSLK